MKKIALFISFLFLTIHGYTKDPLPTPWKSTDIGIVKNGSTVFQSDTYILKAVGRVLFNNSKDAFHFLQQEISGNFEIIAKVDSLTPVNLWSKAGLMVRNTLDDDAKHVMIFTRPDLNVGIQRRDTIGGSCSNLIPVNKVDNVWLKLTRLDDMFIGYKSDNGVNWEVIGYTSMNMNEKIYVGLAATSHDVKRLVTAKFSSLKVDNLEDFKWAPPLPPANITTMRVGDNSVSLNWSPPAVNEFVKGYNVYNGTEKVNQYTIYSPYYTVDGLKPGSEYTFTVSSIDFKENASVNSNQIKFKTLSASAPVKYKVPGENPYIKKYKRTKHWTSSLKWSSTIDARKVAGLLDAQNNVDSAVLQNTIASIEAKGGGVLYFPQGTYYFHHNLNLKSGVILRGEEPVYSTKPGDNSYYLPTHFEFPKYVFSSVDSGTANNTAFKKILADTTGMQNFGLVNLDINRATIEFHAGKYFLENKGQKFSTIKPGVLHKNVIVFGVIQNNACIPSVEIPTRIMKDERHGWQRWPWEHSFNLNVFVSENCVVANCRFNDRITDDFDQEDYLTDGFFSMKGEEAKFSFINREVIAVNSNLNKIYYKDGVAELHDGHEVNDFNDSYFPSKGVEVMDNLLVTRTGSKDAIKTDGLERNNIINKIIVPQYILHDGKESKANNWMEIAKSEQFFSINNYVNASGNTLPYRLMKPATIAPKEKYPLILYLHGEWEAGTDNMKQLKHSVTLFTRNEIREKFPCYVVCPQHPTEQSFITWPAEKPSTPMQSAMELLDQLIKTEQIDPKRIYIFGVSSGGSAALEALLRYNNKFASGLILSSLFNGFTKPEDAAKLKDTPTWWFLGDHDPIYSVPYINLTIHRLKQAGGNPKLTIFPNTGHGVFVKVFEEPQLLDWLFAQKRK